MTHLPIGEWAVWKRNEKSKMLLKRKVKGALARYVINISLVNTCTWQQR